MRWALLVACVLGLALAAWAIPPGVVGGGGGWRTVAQPSGFSQVLPFVVQVNSAGSFRAWDAARAKEWDPADAAIAATKTYYVALTGDDGAAGDEAHPLATYATAVTKSDVRRVIFLDTGPYYVPASTAITRSQSIIGYGTGTVLHGWYPSLSWRKVEAMISGASKANPCVITASGHPFVNGDSVTISGVVGMTELNGNTYTVANAAAGTFELSGVDSSGFTDYISGGVARLATVTVSASHVYTATQADAGSWAFDTSLALDGNGDYTRLAIQTSVANVEANAGSIYITGTAIYVRTTDDRAPDSDIRVPWNTTASGVVHTVQAGINLYLENLKIYGGYYGVYFRQSSDYTAVGGAKDCRIGYTVADGLYLRRGASFSSLRVTAARGQTDGFNYTGGTSSSFAEVSCVGRDNGTGEADNGSTGHDSSIVTMINGEYMRNYGRNVAHITASQLWALGCYAHDSATATSTYDEDWSVLSTGSNVWLHGCRSGGSTTDVSVGAGAAVYLRRWLGGTTYIGTPGAY